jgi:lipopolysaccharide transport system ATP-binding protein
MSNPPIVSVTGLGKRYSLGAQGRANGYVSLRETVMNGIRHAVGRVTNQDSSHRTPFWALRDVSFSVQRGDSIAIVGRNGAGKSTLLKILSRITEPTEGRVHLRGRVASLLEVGTGFHPELTGRENIFLNGAILGMTRNEIRRRFDEIVAFAEVERFLDTPVKRYSSGMYVRLAFAVAAHLDSEILIVDEVLSVGDAAFQQKCLGRMNAVVDGGRTVLFVTHNMPLVQALCRKAILLDRGQVTAEGSSADIAGRYLAQGIEQRSITRLPNSDGSPTITGLAVSRVAVREDTRISVVLSIASSCGLQCGLEIKLYDGAHTPIGIGSVGLVDHRNPFRLNVGAQSAECTLTLPRLAAGRYRIGVQLTIPLVKVLDSVGDGITFEVVPEPLAGHDRPIESGWGCGAIEIPLTLSPLKDSAIEHGTVLA